jgi:hypothetical protein
MITIHRCRKCGHPDFHHSAAPDCSYGGCVCPQDFDPEPEVIPTFTRAGVLDEQFHPPGPLGPSRNDLTQCGCEACRAVLLANGVVAA